MSRESGWAAINLEKPERIPRTEYSAHFHWDLVKKVTGIDVDQHSDPQTQQLASNAFVKAWDYGFMCPGYFMAVGNHIPPNTPVENALYYDEMYRKYSRR